MGKLIAACAQARWGIQGLKWLKVTKSKFQTQVWWIRIQSTCCTTFVHTNACTNACTSKKEWATEQNSFHSQILLQTSKQPDKRPILMALGRFLVTLLSSLYGCKYLLFTFHWMKPNAVVYYLNSPCMVPIPPKYINIYLITPGVYFGLPMMHLIKYSEKSNGRVFFPHSPNLCTYTYTLQSFVQNCLNIYLLLLCQIKSLSS